MIKTAFFDLGNTIIDYHSGKLTDEEKDILGLWRMHTKLKDIGIEIQFEELTDTFYYPWISKCSQRNGCEKEFNMLDFMPTKIKAHDEIKNLILEFHEPTARFAIPIAGIEDVLRELKNKGIDIGIISNTPIP
jgi:FMN phosphatase YigB (HAD superfamily)